MYFFGLSEKSWRIFFYVFHCISASWLFWQPSKLCEVILLLYFILNIQAVHIFIYPHIYPLHCSSISFGKMLSTVFLQSNYMYIKLYQTLLELVFFSVFSFFLSFYASFCIFSIDFSSCSLIMSSVVSHLLFNHQMSF